MRANSWPSILLIFLFTVVAGGAVGKVIPLLADMAAETGTHVQTATWIISAISVASVLLAPFGGAIMGKIGDRRLIAVGLAIMLLANLGISTLDGFTGFLVARMIEGTGFIFVTLGAIAMMLRTTTRARQGQAMSLISTGLPLGVGISLALGGLAAGHWRMAFAVHAIVLAAMLILLRFTPRWSKHIVRGDDAPPNWWAVARMPGPLQLALGIFVATIIMFGFGTLFPSWAMSTFGLSAARAAAYGLLAYPASVIGSLIVGGLVLKVNQRRLILLSFILLAALGSAVFQPALGLNVAAALLFGYYIVCGMVGGIGMAQLPKVVPSPAVIGMTTSLYMQAANLGMLVGAPIMYFTFSVHGATGVAILTLLCSGTTFACWYFLPTVAADSRLSVDH